MSSGASERHRLAVGVGVGVIEFIAEVMLGL